MNTDQPPAQDGDGGCPPPPETDPNCNPRLIDEVACEASGVAAQAVYNATYQDLLATAKGDYDAARKDYRAKRHDASLVVQDLRHQIKHLVERIKCLIEQKRVWRCIDDAFCEIVEELECCEPTPGCCVGECDYPVDDACTLTMDELQKRITEYQAMADAAKNCFTELIAEPAALTARVAAAKAAIDGLNASLGADPATTDLKRVYAQALVVFRDIERIWGGFDETHDYVDCLCRALTCWTKGCAAVSVLTGALAVADCKEKAHEAHCEDLKTNTVDEILARYDKLCGHKQCDDSDGGDNGHGDDDGGDHDDGDCKHEGHEGHEGHGDHDHCHECCHHHERHHRHHGHKCGCDDESDDSSGDSADEGAPS